MLAQNFMSAAELSISTVQFDALVTVLGMLERGEIDAEHFDMTTWSETARDQRGRFSCGTVGCIGGWAMVVARSRGERVAFMDSVKRVPPIWRVQPTLTLDELFHPPVSKAWSATPAQGAEALRNYLTTGEARWPEVMA